MTCFYRKVISKNRGVTTSNAPMFVLWPKIVTELQPNGAIKSPRDRVPLEDANRREVVRSWLKTYVVGALERDRRARLCIVDAHHNAVLGDGSVVSDLWLERWPLCRRSVHADGVVSFFLERVFYRKPPPISVGRHFSTNLSETFLLLWCLIWLCCDGARVRVSRTRRSRRRMKKSGKNTHRHVAAKRGERCIQQSANNAQQCTL